MHMEWRVAIAVYGTENKAGARAGRAMSNAPHLIWAVWAPHMCPVPFQKWKHKGFSNSYQKYLPDLVTLLICDNIEPFIGVYSL